ncbi:MAG: excinuclease ABC subunit C [Rickettsiales bacterium]|jgi:excinuclease ABC subunit C
MLKSLKEQITKAPKDPGVYQFLDDSGKVLYVGKAKNLSNRLKNYMDNKRHNSRIRRMVSCATKIDLTITNTESEALLLECNLIKKLMPRYNILLRDDKTFANILVDTTHPFPSIARHRGKKAIKGKYFGPFASSAAIYETIDYLKKSFLLRSCSDNEFKSRKKPCMEYQIKRCSAPCVGLSGREEYGGLIGQVLDFLSGKKSTLQEDLAKKMQEFSNNLEFEKASIVRDRIKALTFIQAKQNIHLNSDENIDFVALARKGSLACVVVSFFRGGNNYGFKPYFLNVADDDLEEEIIKAFLDQFYADQELPDLIVLGKIPEKDLNLNCALKDIIQNNDNFASFSGKETTIINPKQGPKFNLLQDYLKLASTELEKKINSRIKDAEMLVEIKNLFDLPKIPERIEIYDNSHTSGQYAVGAFVVAGRDGLIKNSYRKFTIRMEELFKKDDTAFLRQVLERRFKNHNIQPPQSIQELDVGAESPKTKDQIQDKNPFPDLIIIDGGKGQLSAADHVFKKLGVDVNFVAMSKGKNRNAGEEWFHAVGKPSFTLNKNSPTMYYLQRLRDEAHRFAIGFNRAKRAKSITKSELDEVPNIGKSRKSALLNHFGSVSAIKEARIEDLMRVKGISKNVAIKISEFFSKN